MKFIIDYADVNEIKRIYDVYPVDGVTTNPSIIARSGKKPFECLREIREFIGDDMLHVQVMSEKADDMVNEAHRIQKELGKDTYIKIPVVEEGLKAIRILKKEGAKVTATTIYSHMQAYLAAKAGADYAAPYLNRIDNLGYNGVQVTKEIHDIFKRNKLETEVLAASFKNSQQVLELCEYGIGACTISPEVIRKLITNVAVNEALEIFKKDFLNLCGEGIDMSTCE